MVRRSSGTGCRVSTIATAGSAISLLELCPGVAGVVAVLGQVDADLLGNLAPVVHWAGPAADTSSSAVSGGLCLGEVLVRQ